MPGALDQYMREIDGEPLRIAEAKPTGPAIKPPRIEAISAADLTFEEFAPLISPVEGLIVEGLTLICGASKIGKSWFSLQMCVSVASGAPFLGRRTQAGTTLYLALEDSKRRLQDHMTRYQRDCPNLFFHTQPIPIDAGLLDALEAWMLEKPDTKLIVIDTLQRVRGVTPGRANAYADDYRVMSLLKTFADRFHVALVLIHHLNKMKDVDDPFDKISGSTGLMGAADTAILIDRKRGEGTATVTYTGRDVYGDDFEMKFDNCVWKVCDPAALAREKYEASPVVRAVKLYTAQESLTGSWPVAFENFRVWAAERGLLVGTSAGDAHKQLESIAPFLEKHDGIFLAFGKNINGKRGMIITRRGEQNAKSALS